MSTLLLHGFTGSSQSWDEGLIDALASLGPPPVLVDLPGHGRHAGDTEPDHFTLEAVFQSITEASAGEPVDLIGYSMGGRMALAYAATFPDRVRRLVLESASPGLATEEERADRRGRDERLAMRLEDAGIEPFVNEWEKKPLFESQRALPPRVSARHHARRSLNDAGSLAASLRGLGTGSQPSYWDVLPTLTVPALLIVGEADTKFLRIGAEMARAMPGAELAPVPDAGHAVHLERPDEWLALVVRFLSTGD